MFVKGNTFYVCGELLHIYERSHVVVGEPRMVQKSTHIVQSFLNKYIFGECSWSHVKPHLVPLKYRYSNKKCN